MAGPFLEAARLLPDGGESYFEPIEQVNDLPLFSLLCEGTAKWFVRRGGGTRASVVRGQGGLFRFPRWRQPALIGCRKWGEGYLIPPSPPLNAGFGDDVLPAMRPNLRRGCR
jgi:hypothetical protein